jgi:T-complex protein 1 subunit eta
MCAYAQAFECIPRQLCENAGLDPIGTLANLRKCHAFGQTMHGVDVNSGAADMWEAGVWEPAIVKRNMICSATEAAVSILSVDLTIKAAPPAEADNLGKMARRAGLQ